MLHPLPLSILDPDVAPLLHLPGHSHHPRWSCRSFHSTFGITPIPLLRSLLQGPLFIHLSGHCRVVIPEVQILAVLSVGRSKRVAVKRIMFQTEPAPRLLPSHLSRTSGSNSTHTLEQVRMWARHFSRRAFFEACLAAPCARCHWMECPIVAMWDTSLLQDQEAGSQGNFLRRGVCHKSRARAHHRVDSKRVHTAPTGCAAPSIEMSRAF